MDAPPSIDFVFPTLFWCGRYVPDHLHHMIFELVKNSLRAVSDKYMDSDFEAPAIKIVIAEGNEDITIKVSDEGGGIARSGLPKIWTYVITISLSLSLSRSRSHHPWKGQILGEGKHTSDQMNA